jgi:hypothetical protein
MAIPSNLPSTLKFIFPPQNVHNIVLLFIVIVTCLKAISRHLYVHLRNTSKDRAGIRALNRNGYLQSTGLQHWQDDGELVRIKKETRRNLEHRFEM